MDTLVNVGQFVEKCTWHPRGSACTILFFPVHFMHLEHEEQELGEPNGKACW